MEQINETSLRELAEQLAHAHTALREAALKLGGEAAFTQARFDVRYLVQKENYELPDAMHKVYKQIIDRLMKAAG